MRTGMELEHEQLVKSVNKMQTGKKEILLVERLIGTEKREKKYIQVSILLVNDKLEKFWCTWYLVTIRELSSM